MAIYRRFDGKIVSVVSRKQGKMRLRISEMLDEPVFECRGCKILFAVKYLPTFDVAYCPRCAAPLSKHTTMREKYLGGRQ